MHEILGFLLREGWMFALAQTWILVVLATLSALFFWKKNKFAGKLMTVLLAIGIFLRIIGLWLIYHIEL